MNNIRKIVIIALSVLLVTSFVQVPLAFAQLNSRPEAVILSLSDDAATDYTIEKIK